MDTSKVIEENWDALKELGKTRMSPAERGRHAIPYNSVYLDYLPLDKPTEGEQGCTLKPVPPVPSPIWPDMGSQHTTDEEIPPMVTEDADPVEQEDIGMRALVLQLIQDLRDLTSIDDPDILKMFEPALQQAYDDITSVLTVAFNS